MNVEQLEERIATLLNVPTNRSGPVFRLFKEKLSDYLALGEALKIENLGIFQLKEQISHSTKRKILVPGGKSLTLIFSPESEESQQDFLFLNIDLNDQKKDYTEFDENIFQLGIDQPLAIDSETKNENGNPNLLTENIENKISELLENSEKNRDFDLWEAHLKSKEQKNILEDDFDEIEDEIRDLSESIDLDEEFIPLSEDDTIDDFLDDTEKTDNESTEKLIEEIDLEDKVSESSFNNETASKFEFDEEILNNKESVQIEEKSARDDSYFDDSENKIPESEESEHENDNLVKKEIEDHSEKKEQFAKKDQEIDEKFVSENEEKLPEISEKEDIEEPTEMIDMKSAGSSHPSKSKKSNRVLLFSLIAIFIVVGMSVIYFTNPFNLFDKYELSSQLQKEDSESKTEIIPSNQIENQEKLDNQVVTQGENKNTELIKNPSQNETNTGSLYSDSNNEQPEESEVSKNIFFDGNKYNVQVSSWKQRLIAEREERKLIDKGYPAFIVRVYIPKFDGTWNRVRVGPYNSLDEAKKVKKLLNK